MFTWRWIDGCTVLWQQLSFLQPCCKLHWANTVFPFKWVRGLPCTVFTLNTTVEPLMSEPLLCPCWTEPGTGAPQRCVVQSRFGLASLHPGCAEERPPADGQQTLGSFQTQSGLLPQRAWAVCPFPLSLPLCPSHHWCWPSLRRLQHGGLSPGWREFQNPDTEELWNRRIKLEAGMKKNKNFGWLSAVSGYMRAVLNLPFHSFFCWWFCQVRWRHQMQQTGCLLCRPAPFLLSAS